MNSFPPAPSANQRFPWKIIVRALLGSLLAIALGYMVYTFAYAYPYCTGPHLSNCGLGPGLALFASMVFAGAALVLSLLLVYLWPKSPMPLALQRTCKLLAGVSAICLISHIVRLNL
ncbi:hypothetical protein FXN63_20685 [Pigmentiphaga aceris]|uniref:Uncharacterized protein n=1 Tax=Pigmentiphaga aceris TaxID=1940612 RepID=A0A5C0B2P2_9BURK|nr:hypothetical protein [Pigmentiphaga aceris]QEI07983.1 hypothetical protein FXN63_20685 [Pigmentiphaga aceris]